MTVPDGNTALIVPVELPPPLEELRQHGVADAHFGLAAHATLLFPFAAPDALGDDLLATVEAVVGRHSAFSFRLIERRVWPGAVYAAVEPEAPFRSLFDELAAAFPQYPLHGGAFPFVPHVTIVEDPDEVARSAFDHPAWRSLPATRVADSVELIVRESGRWTVRSRFALAQAHEAPPTTASI